MVVGKMTRTILQADGPARLAPSCRRETALGEEMSDEAEQKAEQILLEFPDHYSPSNLQVVMAVAAAIREAWQAGHDAADGEPYTDYKSNTRSLQIPTYEAGRKYVQLVDRVWAEEPGVEVWANYSADGGTVLIQIVKDNMVIATATLGAWRWGRLHKIEVDV